jgi:hypothetical protein
LHTRAGQFAEAAVCCRTLETVYRDSGHSEEANRYGELAAKYEERIAPLRTVPPSAAALEEAPAVDEATEIDVPMDVEAEFAQEASEPPPAPSAKKSGLFWHAPQAASPQPPTDEVAEFEVRSAPAADEQEIDLSTEWEGELSDEPAPAPVEAEAVEAEPVEPEPVEAEAVEPEAELPAEVEEVVARTTAIAEAIEEIRFYIENSMLEQAQEAMQKLERLKPNPTHLAMMHAELQAAAAAAPRAPAEEEVSVEEVEAPAEESVEAPPAPKSTISRLKEFVSDSFGRGFRSAPAPEPEAEPEPEPQPYEPEPQPEPPRVSRVQPPPPPEPEPQRVSRVQPPPTPQPEPQPYAVASAEPQREGVLGEFVSDLEASLGDHFLDQAPIPAEQPQAAQLQAVVAQPKVPAVAAPAPQASAVAAAAAAPSPARKPEAAPATFTYQPTPIRPLSPAAAATTPKFDTGAGVDLADMFGELKQELEEETTASAEDPETHYNLGVAFREMGLLDEAIGELQKVCQAVEKGNTFPHIMQTYTWLAQCFLDKGVPEAAIRWYEQALKLPQLDQETRIALHYELAVAYQTAENKSSALSHFMEVYGSNIDYRDVSERIKALKS